ncbi:hypothetical protein ACJZ2D_000574 [Fusarium nematophilum]
MEAVNRLLGSLFGEPQYQRIETDEAYPLHLLDNLHGGRSIILSETLRFNQVLDAAKRHDGLVKLLGRGDWRKLGGRLRQRSDGSLEVHMPKEFTLEHPAVRFTTEAFDISIEEHSLARQLPKATDSPSIQKGPAHFRPFSIGPGGPVSLKDYLSSDYPILGLHVTSFNDATLVALLWPHAVAGALGLKEILSAWSTAIRDEHAVPGLLGARKDVLDGIGTDAGSASQFVLTPNEIKGWGLAKFGLRMLWNAYWQPPVETRAMCLPAQFLSKLRRSSMKELEAMHGGETTPFISEGDVFTAWATRFTAQSRGGNRPALIFNPLDTKSRLDAPWGTEGVYVQNLACGLYTSVDADILYKQPLGQLAHAVRLSIQQQAKDEEIRAQLRIFRECRGTREPLYGDPEAQFVVFSNWTKFDLFNAVDFSPAVVNASSSTADETPVGRPVYMHCGSISDNIFERDCFGVTGKDLTGNFWVTASLYPWDWERLEEYMLQTWERVREEFRAELSLVTSLKSKQLLHSRWM